MKPKPILTALAVAIAALVQPALAEWTFDKNGEPTHHNGVALPPIQTVEQARVATEKRLAAIHAEEAKQAADESAKLAACDTLPATALQELFYTGKPYLEETGQYVFLFRHYDPELGRWTTSDPSGFPDGANNIAYMAVPTSEFDWQGLATKTVVLGFLNETVWGNTINVMALFSEAVVVGVGVVLAPETSGASLTVSFASGAAIVFQVGDFELIYGPTKVYEWEGNVDENAKLKETKLTNTSWDGSYEVESNFSVNLQIMRTQTYANIWE